MKEKMRKHPASFRDPSGFIYESDGNYFRFVHQSYQLHYDKLIQSGLAEELMKSDLLLPYVEIDENHFQDAAWYKTLSPEILPFISYPWEWSFSQLKDAALTTLDICRLSLHKGMILKDATPLNIQFHKGKPKLIDTLSFENYEPGTPWIAYRQFCECFLYPLLITAHTGMEAHRIFLAYPDGIPAAITAGMLPVKTRFHLYTYLHVFLQARITSSKAERKNADLKKISFKSLLQIIDSLQATITKLRPKENASTWSNYYEATLLSEQYLEEKKKFVKKLLGEISYTTVLDLGANTGTFSQLCRKDAQVIAADADSTCIDQFYNNVKKSGIQNIHPIVADLSYPSPSMGVMNLERASLLQRAPADLCLALALIHHLAIGKNIPFEKIAAMLAGICKTLIIEFVPRSDPKVKEMLERREDIFHWYTDAMFLRSFTNYFEVIMEHKQTFSERSFFIMKNKRHRS